MSSIALLFPPTAAVILPCFECRLYLGSPSSLSIGRVSMPFSLRMECFYLRFPVFGVFAKVSTDSLVKSGSTLRPVTLIVAYPAPLLSAGLSGSSYSRRGETGAPAGGGLVFFVDVAFFDWRCVVVRGDRVRVPRCLLWFLCGAPLVLQGRITGVSRKRVRCSQGGGGSRGRFKG